MSPMFTSPFGFHSTGKTPPLNRLAPQLPYPFVSQQQQPAAPTMATPLPATQQPYQYPTSLTQPQSAPGMLPGTSLPLQNMSYLSDPLMSSYYGMDSPYFNQQQQDFYGDAELYSPATVAGAIR